MLRDLIIHSSTTDVEIALLEDKKLVEYHKDSIDGGGFNAGDIFLGRVKKINPGLNAAFIDIGHEKDAFIHYTDLSPNLLSLKKYTSEVIKGKVTHLSGDFQIELEIEKNGSIEQVLSKNDLLIFQILKEAISTKGPRLSCEVTIPGRYLVLAPFTNHVGVSKKLENKEERKRLIDILNEIKGQNFGLVARTNAATVSKEEIINDNNELMARWKKMTRNAIKEASPKLLLSEMDKTLSIIRDIINDSFNRIVTDDPMVYQGIKTYLEKKAPSMVSILYLHEGDTPLLEEFSVSRQVKGAFGKTVTLKSGAYLVLENTEALSVIDVNSGPKINIQANQDLNALNVNLEAVNEIARQMRLRDIGGIIVIDFIDMKSAEYKNRVLEAMHAAMKNDKAKHSILPISKFGLMEITRQRVKEQVNIDTTEPNPSKDDRVESSLLLVDKIEREILSIPKNGFNKYLLYVHPFVRAYLNQGIFPTPWKWYRKTGIWVKILQDSSLHLHDYQIINKQSKEKVKLNH